MKYLLVTLIFLTSFVSANNLISSPKISINDNGLRVIELNIKESNIDDDDIKLFEYKSEEILDKNKIAYTLLLDNDNFSKFSIVLSETYASDYFSFKLRVKDDLAKDIFIFLPSKARIESPLSTNDPIKESINTLTKFNNKEISIKSEDEEIEQEPPLDEIVQQKEKVVSAGEIKTMWSLATDIAKTNGDLSIYQIMWSIYLGNPDAFLDKNINLVRNDVDIVIPSYQAMQANSPAEAKNAIIKMNQAFSLDFKKSSKSLLTLTAPKISKLEEAKIITEVEKEQVEAVSNNTDSSSPEDIISKNTSTLTFNAENEVIEDLTKIADAANSTDLQEKSSGIKLIDLLFVAAISVICGVLLALIFIQLNKNRKKAIVYDFDEAPSSGPETTALPSGLSIKNNEDEQELDLASTYIEMGEFDQANAILQNLLKKSENENLKDKARELITSIQSK
jgi:FimV-like protein